MAPTTKFVETAAGVRDPWWRRAQSNPKQNRSSANRAGRDGKSLQRKASCTSFSVSHAPHAIKLRPAVAHILQIGMKRGRLVVHAERHIRWVLPELLLHLAADLLLHRH